MRRTAAITLLALMGMAPGADDRAVTVHFGKSELNKAPAGWTVAKTGTGEGSMWKVVADDTAPSKSGYALAQVAESPNNVFNLCVKDEAKYKDVELSVAFRAMAGKLDQGGGFVWRYRDANNYYICRMNPLENNYRVYKVVNGKRSQPFQDAEAHVPLREWHTLRVKMTGDRMECFLDGKKYLDVRDASIMEAGKVGLWTKADAQTRFDQFTVSGH